MPFFALLAAVPLAIATWANRRTTLVHALAWAWAAWLGWFSAACAVMPPSIGIALTGCAGVAVLGARRPGAAAWHFVVSGLFVVLLLPLAEAVVRGAAVELDGPRTSFLALLMAVCIGNYLPTRLGLGAALLGIACTVVIEELQWTAMTAAFLAPWAAWLGVRWPTHATKFDETWRDFRNRFGAIWALRLRDQFNAAATNAGLPVELGWSGLRGVTPGNDAAARAFLTALLQRFGLQ